MVGVDIVGNSGYEVKRELEGTNGNARMHTKLYKILVNNIGLARCDIDVH